MGRNAIPFVRSGPAGALAFLFLCGCVRRGDDRPADGAATSRVTGGARDTARESAARDPDGPVAASGRRAPSDATRGATTTPNPPEARKAPLAPAEVLRRASRAVDASLAGLASLKENPSPRTLATACGTLGELEAYLVVAAYLANDGLLMRSTGTPSGGFADPAQWVSTAANVAPLCARRGSSLEDFLEDVGAVRANLSKVREGLGGLSVPAT